MLRLSTIDYALWIVPQICVAVVLWRIMRQRLISEFPSFTAYCALQLVRFGVLFGINSLGARQHYALYFYTYWSFELLNVCLSLAVIREIYDRFFRYYQALQAFGSVLFHWACALLVIMSVAAAAAANGSEYDRIISGVLVFDQVSTTVLAGLLFLLLTIALFFRLNWDRRHFGIVIGFSIYFVVDFVVIAMRRHTGIAGNHIWSLLRSMAYTCCALSWVWTFMFDLEPAAENRFPFSPAQLEEWNSALSNFIR